MRIGLFIPCFIDQFYPKVGIATLELLEKLGLDVYFPEEQTCCGQPMSNSGYSHLTDTINRNFISGFNEVDYIVSPSASCTLHIKDHLHTDDIDACTRIRRHTYELTEFLTDILKIKKINATFPYKVGLHESCHGLRGLHLASMSELAEKKFSKPESLLRMVEGIELIELDRKDECCGFGGTFCVTEEAISSRMGQDRVDDHILNGAEYITASDMSCLMHLEGILRRRKSKTKVIHIAEILNPVCL